MDCNYFLFDLDGTLTDSFEGIANAIIYSLRSFGIEVADKNSLRPFVGPALKDSFAEYYGFSPNDTNIAIAKFREYYADKGLFENRVYDGIPELLSRLKQSGGHLMTATAKIKLQTLRILEHFKLIDYFDFIGTAEPDGIYKKEDIIKYVIDNAPIPDLSRTVMIGDRRHDIFGAKCNGIKSVGVLYGYGGSDELKNAGADVIAQSVDDLHKILFD